LTSPAVSESITRRSASNLALAFILLPPDKRRAMAALYAFCREVDDVADEDSRPVAERRSQLAAWREDVRTACDGGQPVFPVNRELQPVIAGFRLRFDLFDELIRGCETDLLQQRFQNYDELDTYCYRVASVVGLLSIEIFGHQDAGCQDYAVALGKALQLTNILRDVHTDAQRGRIYLPLEALKQHGVAEADILGGTYSERYRSLAEDAAARATGFYDEARRLLPRTDRRAMIAAELMGAVYWRLLLRLRRRHFNVFTHHRVRLSKAHKAALIVGGWLQLRFGGTTSPYGQG
jgi:phytoene synthase